MDKPEPGASADPADRGRKLQRDLPDARVRSRRLQSLVEKRESAGDYASLGDLTDVGPVGWFLGVLAGIAGWFGNRCRRAKK